MTRSDELILPSIPNTPRPGSPGHLGALLGIPSAVDAGERGSAPTELSFPLVRVALRVQILADCAMTELEEHFTNTSDEVMDITHTMPLPPDAAVNGFELIAGDRRVAGVCMESAEARRAFDDATERGKTAAMMHSVRSDAHVIRLGQVAPGSDITVRLRIIQRLRVEEGRFEYRFPTAISPKFVPGLAPGAIIDHRGDGIAPDTDRAPDASSLTPPIRLDEGTPLSLEIVLPADISEITASVPLTRSAAEGGLLALQPTASLRCFGDIVLRAWTRTASSGIRAYADGGRTLVVIDPPAHRDPDIELPSHAVFVLDRSGSMYGTRLTAAKTALLASIAALSERDTFEIIAFDTSVESFRQDPCEATSTRKLEAATWLNRIEARGGTDLLPALRHACRRPTETGRARVVLLLTDGAVANDREILALCRGLDPVTRIHAIAIGSAPSMELLGRLARLARGTTLALDDGDDIAAEVRRFQGSFRGPIAMNLRIVGDGRTIAGTSADLFAGRATTRIVDGAFERIEVVTDDGTLVGRAMPSRSPIALGALWAQERVGALEDRIIAEPDETASCEAEITKLGVSHQIQTRFTSFVAVDETSQVDGEPLRVIQPTDVPHDARSGHLASAFAIAGGQRMRRALYPSISPELGDMMPRARAGKVMFNRALSVDWPPTDSDAETGGNDREGEASLETQVRLALERIRPIDPNGPLTLAEALLVVIASLDPKAAPPPSLRARALAALEVARDAEADPSGLRAMRIGLLLAFLRDRATPGAARDEIAVASVREAVIDAALQVADTGTLEALCASRGP